jgi:class 3 adenylate cyclase/pimeloyl-ACP methyl ester carboxylesterase
MEREVRYCTTEDGVRIAYCVEGEGPAIIMTPDFVEAMSLGHMVPEYEEFIAGLGEGRTLVRYDGRGAGLSQREADWSQEAVLLDLVAVAKACGVGHFTLWGSTTGGGRSVRFAADHPDTVDALILYGAYPLTNDYAPGFSIDVVKGFADMAKANWPMASKLIAEMGRGDLSAEEIGKVAAWLEASIDGSAMSGLFLGSIGWDQREYLQHVSCPTLVIHREADTGVPISVGRDLAAAIPNARFVQLRGSAHWYYQGDTGAIIDAVNKFLDGIPQTARKPVDEVTETVFSSFRTILFTDLVGHTEMMSRLGDERGRAVLREHERITREVLKANGGTEVKTMGDGFMASFGSVTKAVECAIALQRAFAEREGEPLSVRVGLNAGEPIEEDGDLFGATVILASRIAAKADGGEILVADTVRGLCSGKGFLFADRGEFVAKGFEEPVRVYEVSWRG